MNFRQQCSLWSEVRRIAARYTRSGASDAADDLAQDLALDQPTGDGTLVQSSPAARHASLIELRHDLIPELTKSLEDM